MQGLTTKLSVNCTTSRHKLKCSEKGNVITKQA